MKFPIALDFETEPIDPKTPDRAPSPVGLAILEPGKRGHYYAFGHPSGNNCEEVEARHRYRDAVRSDRGTVFHNAPFDLAVGERHWLEPFPRPDKFHDTMILLWLANPYIWLDLKGAAARYCGFPNEEELELKRWILANVPEMKGKRSGWKKYIARAPGDVVAPYAIGDVERTLALWKELRPVLNAMPHRYLEERRVLEPVWWMGVQGIPIDVKGLERFEVQGHKALHELAVSLRRSLRAGHIDLGKRGQVADALEARGWVHPDRWIRTGKSRQRSTNIHDLAKVCSNPRFVASWERYQLLSHMLSTFVLPWLEREEGGRIYVGWDTVRGLDEQGRSRGAKTGRLASSPNVQNISKTEIENEEEEDPFPSLRDFVRSGVRGSLVCGDLSQQEPRITAHFAGGALAQAYRDNPRLDAHTEVAVDMSRVSGRGIHRSVGKTLNLAVTYALGLDALAARLGTDRATATAARDLWRRARPDVVRLDLALRRRWAQGLPITTWGGAEVYVEESVGDRTWEYRALNTLIQRSGAEQLKALICHWHEEHIDLGELILTAHDELVVETATRRVRETRKTLQSTLELELGFSVPFVADVGSGKSWGKAKP